MTPGTPHFGPFWHILDRASQHQENLAKTGSFLRFPRVPRARTFCIRRLMLYPIELRAQINLSQDLAMLAWASQPTRIAGAAIVINWFPNHCQVFT